MTVAVARKFGERFVLVADTQISDRDGTKIAAMPGGLKNLVIDLNCSIAFAGNYVQALDCIRAVRKVFLRTRDFDQLLELLRKNSERGDCDYIVAMHRPEAELRKVWKGGVTLPVEEAWIGDPQVASTLLCLEPVEPAPEARLYYDSDTVAAYAFDGAIQRYVLHKGTSLAAAVGGAIIISIGSPFGHTYSNYAGASAWEIRLDPALAAENDRARATGEKSFGYNVTPPTVRGVPVVSLYIDQARVGAIYDPLFKDEAVFVPYSSLEEIATAVRQRAVEVGGVDTSAWTKPGEDFDAIARGVWNDG